MFDPCRRRGDLFKPLTQFLPLYKGSNDEVVTQFSMGNVEKLGLLKMDFLGLRTLTVIDNALRLIRESTSDDIDISLIPTDDKNLRTVVFSPHPWRLSTGKRRYARSLEEDEAGLF